MQTFLPTLILRHRKENLKKCSLRGLEMRGDLNFYTYPNDKINFNSNYILLTLEGEELSLKDQDKGLLLIDGTWSYAKKMGESVEALGPWIKRTLPKSVRTAYPRVQTQCDDPERGLATLEALFVAYTLLNRPTIGLLDNYYWKEPFLLTNKLTIR